MHPTPIRYTTGDATAPDTDEPAVIAHLCNDLGRWGKGFVVAVTARWPEPERAYRDWYRRRALTDFGLGAVQLVRVAPNTHVANMIGQHGIATSGRGRGAPPVRYDAVAACLVTLAEHARALRASVHMPRIGCGLAGGTWDRIEPLIELHLYRQQIPVTVYDYPEPPSR